MRRVNGIIMVLAAAVLAGCTYNSETTTRPSNWTEQARSDPYDYKPGMDDMPSVSGGAINNLDKDGFKRDLDHVLSP